MVKISATLSRIPIPSWWGPLALAILAVALVATAGLGQGRAAAETTPSLTSMAVSVMPEYDQPRVLVSYRGELNADVALPLEVQLRMPADAEIAQVCSIIYRPDEEHLCQTYEAEPDGQYMAVRWEAVTPIMYVEYYYGSISGAGQRSLDFNFWAPYPVQNLDLFVLEPSDATDFTLTPEPADTVDEQGFRHHSYVFTDISVDEPVSIEMAYARQTDQPSAPPRDTGAAAADGSAIPQSIIISLGVVAAGVLAFVVYSVFIRRFRVRAVARAGLAVGGQGTAPRGGGGSFCRHCGGPVRPESAFCHGCGQEVRPLPGGQE